MADSRLEEELSLARRAEPSFGLGRQQQVIWKVRQRLRATPNRLRRVLALAAAACLLGSLAGAFIWFRARASASVAQTAKDERWELRDGSRILLETPDTRITKQLESNADVSFELTAGAARFEVARRPERQFRVQAGPVRVEVIGTRFRVERQGERTLVSVERGRVRVSWTDGSKELSAGEQGLYPPARAPVALANLPEPSTEPAPVDTRQASPTVATSGAGQPRASTAEELFATADRARAGGRAHEAARALSELLQRFPRDGRAPLAAFTRGRLLLENLGQPAEAARSFAQARALAGGSGALAEDALAREADAWRAAGNTAEAARSAKLYRTSYPRGAHSKEVGELTPAP